MIFNIGKANSEITRLTEELKTARENETALTSQVETLTAENETLKANAKTFADVSAENLSIKTQNAELITKLQTAEKAVTDFDGKVASAASIKAAEIAAGQGRQMLPIVTDEKPATAKAALKGRAKVQADIQEEIDAEKSRSGRK